MEQASVARLLKEIERVEPHASVCTHFLLAEILARMRRNGGLDCPVWVQVTDFDVHRMWMHNGVPGYFAGTKEVAYCLRDKGVQSKAIHVTGIPVMAEFGEVLDRAGCASELGIDHSRMTLPLMGGGAGLGDLAQVADRLMRLNLDFQLIVMAIVAEDFPQADAPVQDSRDPAGRLIGLTIVVPSLTPGVGTVTMTYVFSAQNQRLIAVNIYWLVAGRATAHQQSQMVEAAATLASGFVGYLWLPFQSVRGLVAANSSLIVFSGKDE